MKLSKRYLPTIATIAAGILVTMVLAQLIYQKALQDAQNRADIIIRHAEAVSEEGQQLLFNLNSMGFKNCDELLMRRMRDFLFDSTYYKDIWFTRGNTALCSAKNGFVGFPRTQLDPEFTNDLGIEIWPNTQLWHQNTAVRTVSLGQGNFRIFVATDLMKRITAAPFHWTLEVSPGQTPANILIYTGPSDSMTKKGFFSEVVCADNSDVCTTISASYRRILDYRFQLTVTSIVLILLSCLAAYLGSRRLLQSLGSLGYRCAKGLKYGNFYPLYQPLVELESGSIIGCEVLARFEDKQGSVMPGDFIPVISGEGLSWQFTEQIIATALKELSEQKALPPRFRVSFNLFPGDITSNKVRHLTDIAGMRSTRFHLVLEVIENEALDTQAAIRNLEELAKEGLEFAIDDFGTGFSNMGVLEQAFWHYIKIDRSFVNEIESGAIKSRLVPHIVEIAKSLDLIVVAEGIENEKQHQKLRELNIRYGQGWAFGRPMPAIQLADEVAQQ